MQLSGFATGGPWGPVFLKLVFADKEHAFRKFRWPTIAKSLGISGSLPLHIFIGRYVDDVGMISYSFCSKCLDWFKVQIYQDLVSFDTDLKAVSQEPLGETSMKILDMKLYLVQQSITIYPNITNIEAIMAGDPKRIVKNKVKPYLGTLSKSEMRQLSGELSGRRARWAQMGLHSGARKFAILFDVAELQLAGYPSHVVRSIWHMQKDHGLDYSIAMSILKLHLHTTSAKEFCSIYSQTTERLNLFCGSSSE